MPSSAHLVSRSRAVSPSVRSPQGQGGPQGHAPLGRTRHDPWSSPRPHSQTLRSPCSVVLSTSPHQYAAVCSAPRARERKLFWSRSGLGPQQQGVGRCVLLWLWGSRSLRKRKRFALGLLGHGVSFRDGCGCGCYLTTAWACPLLVKFHSGIITITFTNKRAELYCQLLVDLYLNPQ